MVSHIQRQDIVLVSKCLRNKTYDMRLYVLAIDFSNRQSVLLAERFNELTFA